MSAAILTIIFVSSSSLQRLLVSHAVLEPSDAIPEISLSMASLVMEIQISLLKTAHTILYPEVESAVFKMN